MEPIKIFESSKNSSSSENQKSNTIWGPFDTVLSTNKRSSSLPTTSFISSTSGSSSSSSFSSSSSNFFPISQPNPFPSLSSQIYKSEESINPTQQTQLRESIKSFQSPQPSSHSILSRNNQLDPPFSSDSYQKTSHRKHHSRQRLSGQYGQLFSDDEDDDDDVHTSHQNANQYNHNFRHTNEREIHQNYSHSNIEMNSINNSVELKDVEDTMRKAQEIIDSRIRQRIYRK